MSQQPRKKRVRKVTMVEESMPTSVVATDPKAPDGYAGEPVGDEDGYLVIALAAMVVLIVGLTVVMIVLTAT